MLLLFLFAVHIKLHHRASLMNTWPYSMRAYDDYLTDILLLFYEYHLHFYFAIHMIQDQYKRVLVFLLQIDSILIISFLNISVTILSPQKYRRHLKIQGVSIMFVHLLNHAPAISSAFRLISSIMPMIFLASSILSLNNSTILPTDLNGSCCNTFLSSVPFLMT